MTDMCKWSENGFHLEVHDYYEAALRITTDCDNTFQFNNAGPEENHFKFCPYCGKPIKVTE